MIKKIIIYSEISWDFPEQRHHHLAKYFANMNYEVVFVERVVNRIPDLAYFLKTAKNMLISLLSKSQKTIKTSPHNIKLVKSRFLPPLNPLFKMWNLVHWRLVWKTRQENAIVYSFLDNPYLIGNVSDSLVQGRQSIFDIIHNWWDFPWDSQKHQALTKRSIHTYQNTITDSKAVLNRLHNEYPDMKFHLMLPGVMDYWCSKLPKHNEPKIKVGFFGNLRNNSDIDLLSLFVDIKDVEFHFFGRVDNTIEFDVANVIFHGVQSGNEVAAQLADADIVLLPYLDNDFSRTISPAKYFEALATGALVVSRANLSHLPGWDKFVCVLDNTHLTQSDCKVLIQKQSMLRIEQIEFANDNQWQSRFETLHREVLID